MIRVLYVMIETGEEMEFIGTPREWDSWKANMKGKYVLEDVDAHYCSKCRNFLNRKKCPICK